MLKKNSIKGQIVEEHEIKSLIDIDRYIGEHGFIIGNNVNEYVFGIQKKIRLNKISKYFFFQKKNIGIIKKKRYFAY